MAIGGPAAHQAASVFMILPVELYRIPINTTSFLPKVNLFNFPLRIVKSVAKMAIDESTLKHYLADSPPSIVRLEINPHFEALSKQEKLYAHWISV
jgi:hypothetical protein